MTPRCVCHITDSADPGGAENVILLLIEELARRGIRQELLLINEGWLARAARERGLSPIVLPTQGTFDWRWVRSCAKRLRELHADIVHVHLLDGGFYGSLAALWARTPCVATEHGDAAMNAKSGFRFTLKLAVTQALANRIVAVSETTRTTLLRRIPFGVGKTRVIYNGISTVRFEPGPDRDAARAVLGIAAGSRVIGTLGALTSVKDHATLLRAHARLPADVLCVIAGEGPLMTELTRLAAELGTSDRVVFAGFASDPASVLAAIDVFCLSSVSEGLPLSLIEALAARRPAVCTAVGGISEVLAKARGGRTVGVRDPDALAEALLAALEGRVPLAELPVEFRSERMAGAYFDLYDSVLADAS